MEDIGAIEMTIRTFFQHLLALTIRRPLWTLLAISLLTLLLGWQLPHLSFKTTVYDLVIEDLPEAVEYREFQELFGSDEIIRVAVKAEDVLEPLTFGKVSRLSEDLAGIKGIRRIISLPEIKKTVDPGNTWDMSKFTDMLAPVQLFERNLISRDRQRTIITLVLALEADRDAVIEAVDTLIKANGTGLGLYQIGMPLVSQALAEYTQQDFFHLTPITLMVIALLLMVLFRSPQCLLLPVASVILSIVWTFGFMALVGVSVSMLTIIVPVFLIAVGTAYCMHICTEYLTQAEKTPSPAIACQATMGKSAFPVTLAVLTTIFGIGSLMINRIEAIQEFALFACFGMLSLLVIMLTFFPALLALLPVPALPSRPLGIIDRFFDRLLNHIVALNLNHQKKILLLIGVVVTVCGVGIFRVRVETNPVSFFKPSTPVNRNFHDIYKDMSGSFPMNVVMSATLEDHFENPAHVAEIERLQVFLDKLPGVDKTISFADYLKLVNYVSNGYDAAYYALPEAAFEMRTAMNNFKSLLGDDLFQRFMSSDYSRTNILLLTHIAGSKDFLEAKANILAHVTVNFNDSLHWEVTGLGTVIAASSHLLTAGQVKSLGLSLLLIFTIMVTLFLSGKVGLIAVVPNLFPILVNFGLMGLLDIPLSVATCLIAGVAIGLAVDDTIHYLVRYNAEFKKDLDKDRAMRETVMSVGRPIIFTSCTIGLGFAVLVFSHFQPTALFGFLMMMTMAAALVGDLFILPTLMMHVELVTAWDLLKMMPSVGGISPGMVHEVNQPLNAIKIGSDVIKLMLERNPKPQIQQMILVAKQISDQAQRASRMIQRLGEVGRNMPAFQKEPVQINQPILSALDIMEGQLKLDNIHTVLSLSEELPMILGHYNRLVQVTCNLINNAWEAINSAKGQGQREHAISIRTYQEKGRVVLTLTDTGAGIPSNLQMRVFEPFFTTHEESSGRGLGLSITKEIVRDCGGLISLSSTVGKGTTVTLSFPALVR